ncbi:SAM-dependent methyltransferase [Bacteriovoracaceae bacterium]|nr:SAM-dependent methyltransferase [Bacteriovoracaceae bacterium]
MMGQLVLLGLPIGNPEDISLRSLEALKSGQHFMVEDTRTFIKLLSYFKIETKEKKIDSFHDHSPDNKINQVLSKVKKGLSIYLASEAGSPVISDPMFPLIRQALKEGIKVTTFPGATSPAAALELSGLPPIPYHFHGFLSKTGGGIKSYYQSCLTLKGTHLIFVGPHDVQDHVQLLREISPELDIILTKEMTKMFENRIHLGAGEWTIPQELLRGEFVLSFYVDKDTGVAEGKIKDLAQQVLDHQGKRKTLAKLLAKILDQNDKDIYNQLNRG